MGRRKAAADGEGVSYHDTILRNNVSGADLNAYIDRVENVNQQIADCQSDRRELYSEIKRAGYDVATVREIVKLRATEAGVRYEKEMLLATYIAALGDFATTELGLAGADRMREAAE